MNISLEISFRKAYGYHIVKVIWDSGMSEPTVVARVSQVLSGVLQRTESQALGGCCLARGEVYVPPLCACADSKVSNCLNI
jgi:hypothetical protein